MSEQAKTIYLKDYKKPDYLISEIYLSFDLHDTETRVKSVMAIKQNHKEGRPLKLNGQGLKLISVKIDGKVLGGAEYKVDEEFLEIPGLPKKFTLEIENEINPEANKALEGLYKSGSMFCTQNEPEGFRRITYYLDRSDVMARFTTKIIADKAKYPVLLCNGNPIARGDLENGKHFVEWQDPTLKPSYLFALVAGDLGMIQDKFKTKSGRKVLLQIYCDKGNEHKCHHAMKSLKEAMKWDEVTYGLEYDLDIYMVVAVDSFNMGAMENKGLNIFNSAYTLADQASATDEDFANIQGVIGHEYFHNWTGNRITCRDWFQITLKEGLTVFRDQNFSMDLNSRAVKRIGDVQRLKMRQFVEDAGPMAHPIKPSSFIEINNFYTPTVYEKGAEVIRMIETFLGKKGFRKGMDMYFKLYDGQAVTTEDFVHAMSVANKKYNFMQFKNWYHQAGTPLLTFKFDHDEKKKKFTLTVSQMTPPTPGEKKKKTLHMPLKIALVDKKGRDLPLKLETGAKSQPQLKDGILHLKKAKEKFVFKGIIEKPIPSLNRGFHAPVNTKLPYSVEDMAFLLAHDKDEFNRFDIGQQLVTKIILELIDDYKNGRELALSEIYIEAYGKLLGDKKLDPAFKAFALGLPSEGLLHQQQTVIEVEATHHVRKFVRNMLAQAHEEEFLKIYTALNKTKPFKLDGKSMGERALKNTCLAFLMTLEDEMVDELAFSQLKNATNMTDEISAFSLLCHKENRHRDEAISIFLEKWRKETLVMQKWVAVQAISPLSDAIDRVKALEFGGVYDKTIPNFVRSLLNTFGGNHINFHRADGEGYRFIANKVIEVDGYNPLIASRLAQVFKDMKKYPKEKQNIIRAELERVKTKEGLSKNTFEVVDKILK